MCLKSFCIFCTCSMNGVWSSLLITLFVRSFCSLLVVFICLNPSVTERSGLESPPWLCICLPFAFSFILSMPQLHAVPTNLEFYILRWCKLSSILKCTLLSSRVHFALKSDLSVINITALFPSVGICMVCIFSCFCFSTLLYLYILLYSKWGSYKQLMIWFCWNMLHITQHPNQNPEISITSESSSDESHSP